MDIFLRRSSISSTSSTAGESNAVNVVKKYEQPNISGTTHVVLRYSPESQRQSVRSQLDDKFVGHCAVEVFPVATLPVSRPQPSAGSELNTDRN